jgi:hypothetical protein
MDQKTARRVLTESVHVVNKKLNAFETPGAKVSHRSALARHQRSPDGGLGSMNIENATSCAMTQFA